MTRIWPAEEPEQHEEADDEPRIGGILEFINRNPDPDYCNQCLVDNSQQMCVHSFDRAIARMFDYGENVRRNRAGRARIADYARHHLADWMPAPELRDTATYITGMQ